MSYFAEIDSNNTVLRVLVGDNSMTNKGHDWFVENLGGTWVETQLVNNYAGIDDVYEVNSKMFISRNAYKSPWGGIPPVANLSIMLDSAPRSGNQFFNEVVRRAFPDVFQRWGYLQSHNPKSFVAALGKFDVIATVVRSPIDSMASLIVASEFDTDAEIVAQLGETLETLVAIRDNKAGIFIFDFNEIIANPTIAISKIATKLGVVPKPYNAELVAEALAKAQKTSHYALPINNVDLLNQAKTKLSEPQFATLLTQCTNIYKELIT